jgi:predicted nucleic acid-binding protein
MIVVSDTSCVSNLLTVGSVELLQSIFGEVVVPPTVEIELRRFHAQLPAWLRTVVPRDTVRVRLLTLEVDAGEAEAIVLAKELGADRLLIDEASGRAVAQREGVAVMGVIDILLLARRQGRIAKVRPLLDDLRSKAGFWISELVYEAAIGQAGE